MCNFCCDSSCITESYLIQFVSLTSILYKKNDISLHQISFGQDLKLELETKTYYQQVHYIKIKQGFKGHYIQ